jgi:superkiller protein 3
MFVPVYGAAVVLFFVTDRYRMPLFVPLCAAAGAALVRYFDLVRARQFDVLLRPTGALVIASLVVFSNLGLDNGIGGEQTRKAGWLVEQGSFDEALQYVELVSDAHPHPGVLRFSVAQALLDAGRPDEAAALLVEANAIDGPRPAIRLALGEALIRTGRAKEAVEHLENAYDSRYDTNVSGPLLVRALVLAGRPDDAVRRLSGMADSVAENSEESALDFGTLALEHNAMVEAIRWLQIAVERAPDRAEAHEKLGLAIFLNGDPHTARPYLERACHLEPGSASAHLNLAAVYAELGRFPEARSQALEALRLDPAEPRAAGLLKALPK